MKRSPIALALLATCILLGPTAVAAPNFAQTRDGQPATITRPLRYAPAGTDFVAIDGDEGKAFTSEGKAFTGETFNRPLYGSGTAFRVDAGDRPEFSLFLPGRGGVLRLGVKRGEKAIWLIDADLIEARYRPGSMLYTIRDPLLGEAELRIGVMASFVEEALLAKIELRGEAAAAQSLELIAAFGGATGERGSRNGDIGTERVPVREFFQLKPEHCLENRIEIGDDRFTLDAKPATLIGRSQPPMAWTVADAKEWSSPGKLLESRATETPVVVGRAPLGAETPIFIRIDRRALPSTQPGATPPAALAQSDFDADYAESDLLRGQIAQRVVIQTPDPFLDAAVAALNVGAEGTWDSGQTAVMHGAVAWRNKLLGWRGAYWLDALGLHERTPMHLDPWFNNQNVDPIPDRIPRAEASANLSRNEDALHSNGNLTTNHYDMNLVAVDAFFRHLLWTGDLDYAKRAWPVIERHLAWEKRMFRREFGPQKSPLYEGYACIWASDDLWYNGGGATHASAYNAYHHRMAARVARIIGADGSAYEREADAIETAMREHLWLSDLGHFAEWKDLLGEGLAHPDAAAWTVYHAIDSQVTTPLEAWQLARYAATALPRLPIQGENVPEGTYQVSTTDWFPYQWSTNNVVMAESAHTSLAMFQANRNDDAFGLLKGAILDSMYMGQCPGNVGMATPLDMARSESQRDFADGCGALSRSIIEGLFGIQPDALAGELTITPRFPAEWDRATIRHRDIDFAFTRAGDQDVYTIHSRVPLTKKIVLILSPPKDGVPTAELDGQAVSIDPVPDAVGRPMVRVVLDAADGPRTLRIRWSGEPIDLPSRPFVAARGQELRLKLEVDAIDGFIDPQSVSADSKTSRNGFLTLMPTGPLGKRTIFARVRKGTLSWIWPIELDFREPVEILPEWEPDHAALAFSIRNNQRESIRRDVTIDFGGQSVPLTLSVRPGATQPVTLPLGRPGSYRVMVRDGEKVIAHGTVTNWSTPVPGHFPLEAVDLSAHFNDRVTQIFRNEYLSPRSPFVSLAVPKQGIGSWCKPSKQFEVDDTGLRELAAKSDGTIMLPNGVRFATPSGGDAKNAVFVSRWDDYPSSMEVALSGKAKHAYLLMAGSTQSMQSRFDNGEVVVHYTDGSVERLALRNPESWWPIDQDYPIDDFAFRYEGAIPPRIELKTGVIRVATMREMKGKGRVIEGGAATVLDLPLDASKELKSLTVRAIANEVVIGLMGVTLERAQ